MMMGSHSEESLNHAVLHHHAHVHLEMFAWALILYCASGGPLRFATTAREMKRLGVNARYFIRSCVHIPAGLYSVCMFMPDVW